MRKFAALFCAALALVTSRAVASDLVSVGENGVLSAVHIRNRQAALFTGQFALPASSQAIELVKIRYRSHNQKGRAVTLSGLLAIPKGGAPKGLALYLHGTTADRNMTPSRWQGGTNGSETEAATLALATGGYAVVMPDYLGLGDDPGVHPYPLGAVNCVSGIDMIGPAREAASRLKIAVGPKLWVTGYSEGGAVAMWATRELEKRQGALYQVTAAAPLSGPYDLTGATAQSMVSRSTKAPVLSARLYLAAYIGYTMSHNTAGVRLKDYFTSTIASAIPQVFGHGLTDATIIKRLALKGLRVGTLLSIERALTPHFRDALRKGDTTDLIVRQLKANDCFDWKPQTKMLLVCVKGDAIVSDENTANALTAMRNRGVGDDTAQNYVLSSSFNHVTGVPPALSVARRFFDGGFAGVAKKP